MDFKAPLTQYNVEENHFLTDDLHHNRIEIRIRIMHVNGIKNPKSISALL